MQALHTIEMHGLHRSMSMLVRFFWIRRENCSSPKNAQTLPQSLHRNGWKPSTGTQTALSTQSRQLFLFLDGFGWLTEHLLLPVLTPTLQFQGSAATDPAMPTDHHRVFQVLRPPLVLHALDDDFVAYVLIQVHPTPYKVHGLAITALSELRQVLVTAYF
jgi:hypothetical protein